MLSYFRITAFVGGFAGAAALNLLPHGKTEKHVALEGHSRIEDLTWDVLLDWPLNKVVNQFSKEVKKRSPQLLSDLERKIASLPELTFRPALSSIGFPQFDEKYVTAKVQRFCRLQQNVGRVDSDQGTGFLQAKQAQDSGVVRSAHTTAIRAQHHQNECWLLHPRGFIQHGVACLALVCLVIGPWCSCNVGCCGDTRVVACNVGCCGYMIH